MCMYLSEDKNCGFDKIMAISYLKTFVFWAVTGCF